MWPKSKEWFCFIHRALLNMSWIPDPGLAEKLLFKMRIDTQRTQLRVCIFVIIFFRFLKWTIATVLQLYIYEDVCYIWQINDCKQKVKKKFYQKGIFCWLGFPFPDWLVRFKETIANNRFIFHFISFVESFFSLNNLF